MNEDRDSRANAYGTGLVGLRPEPASGFGHSATIPFAASARYGFFTPEQMAAVYAGSAA